MSRASAAGHALTVMVIAAMLGACLSTPSLSMVLPDGGAADIDGAGSDSSAIDAGDGDSPGEEDGGTTADAEPPVMCPAACSGGCGGGICVIRGVGGSTCPPGYACRIDCASKDACEGTITCAAGMPCIVDCTANKACNSMEIDQNGASSLCLRCSGGNQACNSVTCSASSCTKVCSPGNACNSTCENCTTAAACP